MILKKFENPTKYSSSAKDVLTLVVSRVMADVLPYSIYYIAYELAV